ncbi:hypothetical protein SSTU70S_05079 [Stutzerimonas stutzeri]
MLRGDHLADAERAHHLAEAHRRDVRLALVHPAAHGWIDGQVFDLHQNFVGAGLAGVGLGKPEGVARRRADRPLGQQVLLIEHVEQAFVERKAWFSRRCA